MTKRFEFDFRTKNAKLGCEVMDFLNENHVQYTLGVVDMTAKRKEFVFDVKCSKTNVSMVTRFFNEF